MLESPSAPAHVATARASPKEGFMQMAEAASRVSLRQSLSVRYRRWPSSAPRPCRTQVVHRSVKAADEGERAVPRWSLSLSSIHLLTGLCALVLLATGAGAQVTPCSPQPSSISAD